MKLEAWQLSFVIIPCLILVHLAVAPFTKVEESFNIQAIHDFIQYGIPLKHANFKLKTQFDHMTYPGAVPRTFVGALVIGATTTPVVQFFNISLPHQQTLARGTLGLLNGASLLFYASGVRKAYGKWTALAFVSLLCGQFHVFFYASRTLPNMYAFGISTVAQRFFLPDPTSSISEIKRKRLAFYLLTLATVIFRAELALLMAAYGLQLLILSPTISTRLSIIRNVYLPSILSATVASLLLTVTLDTYLWQSSRLLWPELAAFLSNIFPPQGHQGASAWGTSPWHWYFTSAIPRLLLNPVLLLLLPYGLLFTPSRNRILTTLTPPLLFTALYSLLPHKETRFLFPIIPPLTLSLALPATHLFQPPRNHHPPPLRNLITPILLLTTLITPLISHTILLPLSSTSYPGAHALLSLHSLSLQNYPPQREVNVHITNLALQTGVTRFLELPVPEKPLVVIPGSQDGRFRGLKSGGTRWTYDKTEDVGGKGVGFWDTFDYAIVESTSDALPSGGWDVIDTISTPGRPRIVRPGPNLEQKQMNDSKKEEGTALLLRALYGDGIFGNTITNVYKFVEDVLRHGRGTGVKWTRGWWLEWGLEERLVVLKRNNSFVRGGGDEPVKGVRAGVKAGIARE